MKKNKLFIAGLAGVMMAAALILSGCGEDKTNTDPKKIVITGLPADVTGEMTIGLASSKLLNGDNVVAMGHDDTVSNGRVEAELYDAAALMSNSLVPWTGTGSYYVYISSDSSKTYISKNEIGINDATTTIAFDSFESYTASRE